MNPRKKSLKTIFYEGRYPTTYLEQIQDNQESFLKSPNPIGPTWIQMNIKQSNVLVQRCKL